MCVKAGESHRSRRIAVEGRALLRIEGDGVAACHALPQPCRLVGKAIYSVRLRRDLVSGVLSRFIALSNYLFRTASGKRQTLSLSSIVSWGNSMQNALQTLTRGTEGSRKILYQESGSSSIQLAASLYPYRRVV